MRTSMSLCGMMTSRAPVLIGQNHLPTAWAFWVGYFRVSPLRPYAFPYGTSRIVAHGFRPRRGQEFAHGHEYRQSLSGFWRPNTAGSRAQRDRDALRQRCDRRRPGQVCETRIFKIWIFEMWISRGRHFLRMRSPRRYSRRAGAFTCRVESEARRGHALRVYEAVGISFRGGRR